MKKKIAIVIHLYYVDNWPLFRRKLLSLPKDSFDLFITMPKSNLDFIGTVRLDFKSVEVMVVKNKGRDVLPFVMFAKKLYKRGYRTVLKFHSKKSTHRDDGQEWLESMLDQIIPEDIAVLKKVLSTVRKAKFGVLGPASVYYPLTINFPANGAHMTRVIKKIYGKAVAYETLQRDRKEYGFFGGTMFWINLESIEKLLNFSTIRFESEKGQIDGTFAHALERMFCVVPEIEGYNIYESDGLSIEKRQYRSDIIPEWSRDHDKN